MAKDFTFKKPEYKITESGKNVQCYIPVAANNITSMRFLINLKYIGGGIAPSIEIEKAYDNVCCGGYGNAKYVTGDNIDVDFAKKLAYRKAVRNLHKKIAYFYNILQTHIGFIYWKMKDIMLDYYDNVEEDNGVIERFVLEDEEKIRKMPEPQNGWIGRTNSGDWFIVVRQPDNDDYYTMVYKNGGFDRGVFRESSTNCDFNRSGICDIDNDSIDLFVKANCFLDAATLSSRDENIIWRRRFEEMEDSNSNFNT